MATYTNKTTGPLDVPGKGFIAAGASVDLTKDEAGHPIVKGWLKLGILAEKKPVKISDG